MYSLNRFFAFTTINSNASLSSSPSACDVYHKKIFAVRRAYLSRYYQPICLQNLLFKSPQLLHKPAIGTTLWPHSTELQAIQIDHVIDFTPTPTCANASRNGIFNVSTKYANNTPTDLDLNTVEKNILRIESRAQLCNTLRIPYTSIAYPIHTIIAIVDDIHSVRGRRSRFIFPIHWASEIVSSSQTYYYYYFPAKQ